MKLSHLHWNRLAVFFALLAWGCSPSAAPALPSLPPAPATAFTDTPSPLPPLIPTTASIQEAGQDAAPTDTEYPAVTPATAFTDTPSPLPPLTPTATSIQESGDVIYYYFVDVAAGVFPEGSVVIMPDAYILAPMSSAWKRSSDTVSNLRAALTAVLIDERNGWESKNLEIVEIAFDDGHATVALAGEYFGVGDVTLIAARMQILMTLFAEPSVQTATVKLNDNTIANLGVSHSSAAKPADYVFTRTEIEDFINQNAYALP